MAGSVSERQKYNDPIDHLDFEISEAGDPNSIDHLDFEPSTITADVTEMSADKEAQLEAKRLIGTVALTGAAETNIAPSRYGSLLEAMKAAYEGDKEAKKMVRLNVKTDVIERTIKAGHVIKVGLHVDEAGEIYQHGQTMTSVQANSLKFAARSPQMRARTEAEVTNYFRIKNLYKQGILEDHSIVIFSCAPDDMSLKSMKEAGFFTDTMSSSVQVTTAPGGKLTTESAFVAGVREPGGKRHDIETVNKVARTLGVDLSRKTVTEKLATPILVRNEYIKKGAIDIAKLLDDVQGGVFFGQAKPVEDYSQYLEKCKEREATLDPKVDLITEELLAIAPKIRDEVHATQLLNEISGKHMIEQAVFDAAIDPAVFGLTAAAAIYSARQQFEVGNHKRAIEYMEYAKDNDESDSCPGGPGADRQSSQESSNSEPCTFVSKKCPVCDKKNVLTTVTATHIEGKCGCVKAIAPKSSV